MENEVIDPVEPQEPTEPEASEPTEPEEGAEPSEPAEPAAEPAKPKENRVQARIDEITREKYAEKQRAEAATREAEYWKKVANGEIKAPQAEPRTPAVISIPNLPPEPNQDDFDDWSEYNKALAIWGGKVALAEQEHRTKQQKEQESRDTVRKSHDERVNAAKAKYADWDEVFALAPDMRFNDTTFAAIIESDQSADIGYYLASKPEEAARINALSPVQQIKEIAKLETKFSSTAAPVKRVTQAPTPINAINGSDAGAKDPDKMSDEEWLAYEKARLAKLGRRY